LISSALPPSVSGPAGTFGETGNVLTSIARLFTQAMKNYILATFVLGAALAASAVSPNFTTVTPAGGQRGKELEVTLRGERLTDTQEIFLYDKGIEVLKLEEAKDNTVKAKIRISPDCRMGEHVLRIRTASGISPMRIFFVGPLPSVEEVESSKDPRAAQIVPLNNTVLGTLSSEDTDFFEVEAKKGERLSVEVEGTRLGRTMLDAYLAIRDSSGKLIAENDDNALLLQDPFLSILAPEDGKYIIELRDSSYSGNNHSYRLHVGTFPRPAGIYPPGGKAGETFLAKLIGDAAGDFNQEVHLPNQPNTRYGVIPEKNGLAPSPNWVRVTAFPNVLEAEPNNEQAKATVAPMEVPLAVNGIINGNGDSDWFKFKAKKGQSLEFTLYARRLGLPVDSVIQVFDTAGKSLGQNDDAGNSDSYLRLSMPADGEYFVKVTDHLNRGGATYAYRVEIAEARQTVTLNIPDTARYDNETRKSIVVPKGNRFAVLMNASRNNYSGDLALDFPGLPKGVTFSADTLISGQNSLPIVFEAAADATVQGTLLEPIAKAADGKVQLDSSFRHTVEWVRVQNATVYVQSQVDRIAAAVVDEVPFKVSIVEPSVPLVQNGYLELQILAERKQGFDEPINVKMLFNPPGVGSLPEMTIAKGSNSVLYRLNANGNATMRKWKIAIVAGAKVGTAVTYASSQLAGLEVAAPFLAGKLATTSVERGKTTKVTCSLEQKAEFDGKAKVKLVGLPSGVTAEEVEITKDSKEAVFTVKAADNSTLGPAKQVFCNVTIKKGGEEINQSIATGGVLRVDAQRIKVADAKAAIAPAAPKKAAK
jgi:hypothetical protein